MYTYICAFVLAMIGTTASRKLSSYPWIALPAGARFSMCGGTSRKEILPERAALDFPVKHHRVPTIGTFPNLVEIKDDGFTSARNAARGFEAWDVFFFHFSLSAGFDRVVVISISCPRNEPLGSLNVPLSLWLPDSRGGKVAGSWMRCLCCLIMLNDIRNAMVA